MADVIQGMLQQALGDAARASKFDAYINFNTPALGPQNTEIYLHVKTSVFPGKSHEPIDLKYKGRSIPIRGQVKYDNTWTCSFYLTEGHELKLAFEDWIESLDQTQNMSQSLSPSVRAGQAIGNKYMSEMAIAQMDFSGEGHTSVYTLHNVFPKSVSAVQVDHSSTGQVLEFTVEFSYSHFTGVQVGGVKLPAKGINQGEMSVLSGIGSKNFIINSSQDFSNTIKDASSKAKNDLANALLSSTLSGDFSNLGNDVRNIATNFGGASLGAVIGAIDSSKNYLVGSLGRIGQLQPVNRAFDNVFNRISSSVNSSVSNIASNIIKRF